MRLLRSRVKPQERLVHVNLHFGLHAVHTDQQRNCATLPSSDRRPTEVDLIDFGHALLVPFTLCPPVRAVHLQFYRTPSTSQERTRYLEIDTRRVRLICLNQEPSSTAHPAARSPPRRLPHLTPLRWYEAARRDDPQRRRRGGSSTVSLLGVARGVEDIQEVSYHPVRVTRSTLMHAPLAVRNVHMRRSPLRHPRSETPRCEVPDI